MLDRAFLRGLVPLLCFAAVPLAWGCAQGTGLVSPPEESGTIVGRVIDALNGSPIAGATITGSPVVPATTTDATGHFELADLELDVVYTVRATKTGYLMASVQVPVTRAQSFIGIELTLARF